MVSSALDIILLSWYWLVVAIVYESAVWGDPPKTLGAVPMTEQAVWGVGSAGKPRAPSQRPVPRDCRDHNCFQSSKTSQSHCVWCGCVGIGVMRTGTVSA